MPRQRGHNFKQNQGELVMKVLILMILLSISQLTHAAIPFHSGTAFVCIVTHELIMDQDTSSQDIATICEEQAELNSLSLTKLLSATSDDEFIYFTYETQQLQEE